MENGKHIENFFYYIILCRNWPSSNRIMANNLLNCGECVCVSVWDCVFARNDCEKWKKEEDGIVEIVKTVKTWGRIPAALCLVWNFQLFRINFCCSCCQQNISIRKCSQLLTLARLPATHTHPPPFAHFYAA